MIEVELIILQLKQGHNEYYELRKKGFRCFVSMPVDKDSFVVALYEPFRSFYKKIQKEG